MRENIDISFAVAAENNPNLMERDNNRYRVCKGYWVRRATFEGQCGLCSPSRYA